MNGETLLKSVKASIIKVALIKKWLLITVHVYYNNYMSNQLYIENKGKNIQLKRGGGVLIISKS